MLLRAGIGHAGHAVLVPFLHVAPPLTQPAHSGALADPPDKPTGDSAPGVAQLPDEERRKLFDLPPAPPAASAMPPAAAAAAGAANASFLELDYERAAATASARLPGKVVKTIRVRGIVALLRIALFTIVVTTFALWGLRFVYRY